MQVESIKKTIVSSLEEIIRKYLLFLCFTSLLKISDSRADGEPG